MGTGSTGEQALERGNSCFKQQDFTSAILAYTEAIRLKADYADAYYNRGLAYFNLSHREKVGEVSGDSGLLVFKHGTVPWQVHVRMTQRRRDRDKAIADFTEAIRLKPDFADAYYLRGSMMSLESYLAGYSGSVNTAADNVIADSTEAIRLNPGDAMAYSMRGNVYRDTGNMDKAIADWTKAIQFNPDDVGLDEILAVFMNRLDKANESLSESAKAEWDKACGGFSDEFERRQYDWPAERLVEWADSETKKPARQFMADWTPKKKSGPK